MDAHFVMRMHSAVFRRCTFHDALEKLGEPKQLVGFASRHLPVTRVGRGGATTGLANEGRPCLSSRSRERERERA
eukprot:7354971-Alexandrium_andersonii.AAC.1